MSVEYSSGIAVGFKLSDAEVQRFPEEIKEDLQDYGNLIQLDTWSAKCNWILNFYNQYGPDEGEAVAIDSLTWEPDEWQEICATFRRYFPERSNEEPRTYLYTRVY